MTPTAARPQRRFFLQRRVIIPAAIILILIAGAAILYYLDITGRVSITHRPANNALIRWFREPSSRTELATAFDAPCPGYPFLVPSSGLIGGLPYNAAYGPYDIFNPHPGIDIFGDGPVGTIPIYAAYDGYLTREANWTSSVIIRHDDPLHPGQTIWSYYTHMADLSGANSYILPDYPPGTYDVPIQQGDLLGYQGVYNGGMGAPRIGLHLHFSIVSSDPQGGYRNEAVFENTIDPTPYLGLKLNDSETADFPLRCLPPV